MSNPTARYTPNRDGSVGFVNFKAVFRVTAYLYALGGSGMYYDVELAGSTSLTQETLFTNNWPCLIRNCPTKQIVLLDSPSLPA